MAGLELICVLTGCPSPLLLCLKGVQSCLLTYVANIGSDYQLATCCFITPGDFFCCWTDTAIVLKGTKRQDVEYMQSCNKINAEIWSLLLKVYCNNLRKCYPQEGSVITFIPPLEVETPQVCLWRKGWKVWRKEEGKVLGIFSWLLQLASDTAGPHTQLAMQGNSFLQMRKDVDLQCWLKSIGCWTGHWRDPWWCPEYVCKEYYFLICSKWKWTDFLPRTKCNNVIVLNIIAAVLWGKNCREDYKWTKQFGSHSYK